MNGLQKVDTGWVKSNIFKINGKKTTVLSNFTLVVQTGSNGNGREEGKEDEARIQLVGYLR